MKIESNLPIYSQALRGKKRKSSSDGGGAFTDMLGGVGEGEAATSADAPVKIAPPPMVGGILSVQEVAGDETRRGRTIKRGHQMLDALEDLKLSILLGEVSVEQLGAVRERMREQKEKVNDPELREVMNQIEIRAAVELAKFGL